MFPLPFNTAALLQKPGEEKNKKNTWVHDEKLVRTVFIENKIPYKFYLKILFVKLIVFQLQRINVL